jgi:hypothetical protein
MTIKIKDKAYTDEDIIKCLVTCEKVISKNAYLEKKWEHYQLFGIGDYSAAEQYKEIRIEWMGYREKLRALLLNSYSMKEIIQKTKACTDKATQKIVKEIISLIE